MNRDPLGEIPGINLYRYVDDDPVAFADTYGLTLSFAPTASPEFESHWIDVMNTLSQSPRGLELLQQVSAATYTVEITPEENGSPATSTPSDAFDGLAFIELLPPIPLDLNPGDFLGISPDNEEPVPPNDMVPCTLAGAAVVLAHELGHTLGYADNEEFTEEDDPYNVTANENPVRQDFGIPLRPAYHGDFMWPQLIP